LLYTAAHVLLAQPLRREGDVAPGAPKLPDVSLSLALSVCGNSLPGHRSTRAKSLKRSKASQAAKQRCHGLGKAGQSRQRRGAVSCLPARPRAVSCELGNAHHQREAQSRPWRVPPRERTAKRQVFPSQPTPQRQQKSRLLRRSAACAPQQTAITSLAASAPPLQHGTALRFHQPLAARARPAWPVHRDRDKLGG
jgi:hypothetical protein